MPLFKLTHFDQVWDALNHPGNSTEVAQAYRRHIDSYPPACSIQEVHARNLNFLLSQCDRSPRSARIKTEDIQLRADGERVFPLRSKEAGHKMAAFVQQLWQTGSVPGVSVQPEPQVLPMHSKVGQILRGALAAFKRTGARDHPAPLPVVPRVFPARAAFFQHGRPYADDEGPRASERGTSRAESAQTFIRGGLPYGTARSEPQTARQQVQYSALVGPPSGHAPAAPSPPRGPRVESGGGLSP